MKRIQFIEPSAPVLRRGPPSGPEWLHEVKFDGWRAQLPNAGRDMDTPVNMVGALFKCCLSQFWKMIVAKRAMLLPWSALIFAVERSGRRCGYQSRGSGAELSSGEPTSLGLWLQHARRL